MIVEDCMRTWDKDVEILVIPKNDSMSKVEILDKAIALLEDAR